MFIRVGFILENRQKFVQTGQKKAGGFFETQGQGRVQHVRGSKAEVEIAAVLPQAMGYLVHERGHVMMGFLLDGQNTLDVALGLAFHPVRDCRGNEPGLRQGFHGCHLYLQPG